MAQSHPAQCQRSHDIPRLESNCASAKDVRVGLGIKGPDCGGPMAMLG